MAKNKAAKTTILVIVSLLAAGAVLFFYKFLVQPPHDLEQVNVHSESIKGDIAKFTGNKPMAFNDSLFVVSTDKIDVFKEGAYLSDEDRDSEIKELVLKYVPVFKELCDKKFSTPKWGEAGQKEILARIKQLRQMTLKNGTEKAVQGNNKSDLNYIEDVISNYRNAKNAAAVESFQSIDQARRAINNAATYAEKDPIYKSDLQEKLVNVKVKIGDSHYRHLVGRVNKLNQYRYITEDEFNKLKDAVFKELEEYNDFKSYYGSAAKNLDASDGLRTKAFNAEDGARKYYELMSQPQIKYALRSDWEDYITPDLDYLAFQSYSNIGKGNQDATMMFIIKGFETFKFRIRSYAETTYDFVMVGYPNSMPTRTSNYSSTSGNQQSINSWNSYKEVTFYNLNKDSEYKIYVTYTKDGSGNNNDDRGYVLLPKYVKKNNNSKQLIQITKL